MKTAFGLFNIVTIAFIFLQSIQPVQADFDQKLLQAGRDDTNASAGDPKKALEALTFSTLQHPGRVKLPGRYQPYLETGLLFYNVDSAEIQKFTTDGTSPSTFTSAFAKVGMGLPWGCAADLGFSQVFSDHKFNAIYLTLSHQVIDASTVVYTDVIPAVTIQGTFADVLGDNGATSFTVSGLFGLYHRKWLIQGSYAVQATQATLLAVSPGLHKTFIRHGFITHIPFLQNWFVRTEVFATDLSAAIAGGYQF